MGRFVRCAACLFVVLSAPERARIETRARLPRAYKPAVRESTVLLLLHMVLTVAW